MADFNSTTFCARPYRSRVITNSGYVRPCCHFRSESSLTEEDFRVLQSDLARGIKRRECNECWQKEEMGLDYTLRDSNQNQPLDEINNLEINLSNLCNMKCRMCGPDSSNKWIDEHVHLFENTPVGEFRADEGRGLQGAFKSDGDLVAYLDSLNLSCLKNLKVAGGEPFMHRQFLTLLRYFVDRENTDFEFMILTNGSIVTDEFLDLLKQFKNVKYSLSLEATGRLYEYIRSGRQFTFEQIQRNFDRIKSETDFRMLTNCATSAHSIYGIGELLIWALENLEDAHTNFHSYPVFVPDYLSPSVIPPYFRERAWNHSKKILEAKGRLNEWTEMNFYRLSQYDLPFNEKLFQNFLTFTRETDKYRGENFAEVVPDPEFREVLETFNAGGEVAAFI